MMPHGLGGGGTVSLIEGGEDGEVLLAGETEADEIVDAAVREKDTRLDVAFLDGAGEGLIAGTEEDGFVEREIGIQEFMKPGRFEFLGTAVEDGLVESLHHLEVLAEHVQVAWGETFRRFQGGEGFDRLAHLVELAGGYLVERAHHGTETGNQLDKSLRGKLGDGFADGGG